MGARTVAGAAHKQCLAGPDERCLAVMTAHHSSGAPTPPSSLRGAAGLARVFLSIAPSSAAVERIFSLCNHMFGDAQLSALADYVQGFPHAAREQALPPVRAKQAHLPWPRQSLWRLPIPVALNLLVAANILLLHVPEVLCQF